MVYYLVGMMGSGKTYYGAKLAERLNVPFVDLDRRIEELEERTINQIFETDGEAYFREIESKHLRELTDEYEHAVIATGGGTPCFDDNMVWMRQTGHTIYMRVPAEVLIERLSGSAENRPLIRGLNETDLYERVHSLLEKRQPYYLQAHEIVDMV
jgi:shikimate kinase